LVKVTFWCGRCRRLLTIGPSWTSIC